MTKTMLIGLVAIAAIVAWRWVPRDAAPLQARPRIEARAIPKEANPEALVTKELLSDGSVTIPAVDDASAADPALDLEPRYLELTPEKAVALKLLEQDYAAIARRAVAREGEDPGEIRQGIAREFVADLRALLAPRELADYLSIFNGSPAFRQYLLGRLQETDDGDGMPTYREVDEIFQGSQYGWGGLGDLPLAKRWIVAQSEQGRQAVADLFLAGLADERILRIQGRVPPASATAARSVYAAALEIAPAVRGRTVRLLQPSVVLHVVDLPEMRGPRAVAVTEWIQNSPTFTPAQAASMLESPLGRYFAPKAR